MAKHVCDYRQKNAKLNVLRMLVLSMGEWIFGYYITCMNALSKPIISGSFGYTEENTDENTLNTIKGMVNFIFAMGALIGTLSGGQLASNYGRRPILYLGEIIALLSIVPFAISNLPAFMVGRFVIGLGAGINLSVFSVTAAELLPNKLCGLGGIVAYLFLTAGVLLSYLCQNIFSYQTLVDYWQVFIFYPLIVSVFRLCLFPFAMKTDTPKFVYEQANKIEHSHHWRKIHPISSSKQPTTNTESTPSTAIKVLPNPTIDSERTDLKAGNPVQQEISISDLSHIKGIDKIKEAFSYIYHQDDLEAVTLENIRFWEKRRAEGMTKIKFNELFGPKYRRQFASGCFVSLAQQLTGINFFSFYSTVLFDSISGNGKTVTLIVGLVKAAGTIVSLFTTLKLGRKPNLVIGSFGEAVGWGIFLIGYKLLNVPTLYLSVIIYMVFYTVGLGSTQALYIAEILPPVGVGFALAVQWAFIGITGLIIPFLVNSIGFVALAVFFLIFSLLAGLFLWLTAVETKEKTSREIFDDFNKSFLQVCNKSANSS